MTQENISTATWGEESGDREYEYRVYPIETSLPQLPEHLKGPGNYIFAKRTAHENWCAVYIGETEDLGERLDHAKVECLLSHRPTHVHVHENGGGLAVRQGEVADLCKGREPPCNHDTTEVKRLR